MTTRHPIEATRPCWARNPVAAGANRRIRGETPDALRFEDVCCATFGPRQLTRRAGAGVRSVLDETWSSEQTRGVAYYVD